MTTTETAASPAVDGNAEQPTGRRQDQAAPAAGGAGHSGTSGATIWLTGLPSAGKSTIAHALGEELRRCGAPVEVLDGDQVRPYLSTELGYSREDRNLNVTRVGFVARLLSSHGVVCLVPVIAPYADARASVRADHERHHVGFAEVHVSTSLELAEQRDVKGLYAQARRGEISGLTGVDDPYQEPHDAELVLDTAEIDVPTAVSMIKALLAALLGRDPE